MKQILIAALLFMACAEVSGQIPLLKPDEMHPDTVRKLLSEASTAETEDAKLLLKRAVRISEETSFDEGVRKGYQSLIDMYSEKQEATSEFRTRLQFINYLEAKEDTVGQLKEAYKLGLAYLDEGIFQKAAERFQNVCELAEGLDPQLAYDARKRFAWSLHQVGKLNEAKANYMLALDKAEAKQQVGEMLWIQQQLSRIAHLRGRFEEELGIAAKVLELAEQTNNSRAKLKAMNNMGYANKYLGRMEDAEKHFRALLNLLLETPDTELEAGALLNLGVIHQNKKDFPEAIRSLEDAARKSASIKDYERSGMALDYISRVFYQMDDSYNALQFNENAISIAKKHGYSDLLLQAYATRSLIYQSLYEFEDALEAQENFIVLRDSLKNAEELKRREAMQDQYVLERMEKEMEQLWADKELRDLEIEKLTELREAEKKTALQEKMRLAKESELKSAELQNRVLEARRAQAANNLLQQQIRNRLQASAIDSLDRQRQIQALELEKQRLVAQEEESKARELANKNRMAMLENEAKEEENRRQSDEIKYLTALIGGLGILLLIILLVLLQLRKKNRKIQRQQVLIGEEKEKSDKLLLNILPPTVAEELKEKGQSAPRLYDEVSVVFTDFQGFTMISEQLSPPDLVARLDAIFLEFDLIVERNGLQRIKTIGDAYMCACGLPEPDADHARKAVTAALEMRDFIARFNSSLPTGAPHWNIRVGVNSGPVVAGVVGIRKFAYDIWGDTVNLASRMESSGEVGKVNISGLTKEIVDGKFSLEYRGKVAAKNKGEVDMFFAEQAAVTS